MVEKENIKPDFGRFLEEYQLFIWKLCNRYADGDPDVGLDYVQEIQMLNFNISATVESRGFFVSISFSTQTRSKKLYH